MMIIGYDLFVNSDFSIHDDVYENNFFRVADIIKAYLAPPSFHTIPW